MSDLDYFSDVPDEVLDGEEVAELKHPDDIIEDAQSTVETADIEQDTLLTYITQNKDIWVRAAPILKPEYFEPEYRSVVKFVKDYYKEHGALPPKRIIHAKTRINLDVVDDAGRDDVVEYILGQVDGFCRHQAFLLHAEKIADAFAKTKGNMTRNQIATFLKQGQEVNRISIMRDLGIEIHDDAKHYLELEKKFGAIPTGIGFVDKALGGGVGKPSMNVVAGATGQGKSIFLMNIAFNYVLRGHNVVFYTLELEYPMVVKRFAAIMTATDIGLVSQDIHSISNQLKMSKSSQGSLQIMKFPMNSTILDIESHYKDLCLTNDMVYDVVCIDYIDVMAPADDSIKRNEIHIKDKDISEDMNNFFHENMIIGWTAAQQTKTAVEEKELKTSNVGGGRSKADTSDNLIMLRRNEEEREQEILWAIIRKARSSGGIDTKIPLRWNGGSQRMSDGDMDIFIKENPHIFGKKSREMREQDEGISETIKNDAIAKEVGVKKKEKENSSERKRQAISIRSNLHQKINAGRDDGKET